MKQLVRQSVQKLEPYEPGKPLKEVEREQGIANIIKMASNENCLGPSPNAIAAINESLTEINLYPDGSGYYLKKKIAERLGVTDKYIILGNGSDEIIRMIEETFLNSGEEAVMGEPAFIIYQMATRIMDGKCRPVPLKNYCHDLPSMAQAVNEQTKLVFIANPNNPTGTMVTREDVERFIGQIPEEVIVVFDEAYYEYIERDDFPQTIDYVRAGRNVIVLRTFSKIYGLAGLRIGYGITCPGLVRDMNRVRQPFNTNSIAQSAALGALDDEEHVRRSRELNRKGKEYIYQELKRIGISYVPSEANFILINTGYSGSMIFKRLLSRGIIVRAMGLYGLPKFIRVTIGTQEQNERFITEFEQVIREM